MVAALLLGGVLLTGFSLLLIGWSVYALGHIGTIISFLLIGWMYRDRMDPWAWVGLAVVLVGLIGALPQVFLIWSAYTTRMTGGEMLIPAAEPPFGVVAEYVTWIGLAFYALAARGARALPDGVAWIFIAAALVGIWAAVRIFSPLAWIGAIVFVAIGLVWVAGALPAAEADGEVAEADALQREATG
jgi:hypothetical protein